MHASSTFTPSLTILLTLQFTDRDEPASGTPRYQDPYSVQHTHRPHSPQCPSSRRIPIQTEAGRPQNSLTCSQSRGCWQSHVTHLPTATPINLCFTCVRRLTFLPLPLLLRHCHTQQLLGLLPQPLSLVVDILSSVDSALDTRSFTWWGQAHRNPQLRKLSRRPPWQTKTGR